MMKFILQREASKPCDYCHNCDSCTTHTCSDTILVSEQVSQEEYVATLLEVIRKCEQKTELVGDDLQGEICILNYMSKAESQLHKIESGKYQDSNFTFII